MKRGLLSGVVFVLLIGSSRAAGDAADEAIKKDRKLIEGTWRAIALEVDGNKSGAEDVDKITVVNGADGSWVLNVDGQEINQGSTTIDPSKTPKTIDITVTSGEGKGMIVLGIYEVDEKTRKLCFAPMGKPRPTEFSSPSGSEIIFATFKREKSK